MELLFIFVLFDFSFVVVWRVKSKSFEIGDEF